MVIQGDGSNLLCRDWLKVIRINWIQIFKVSSQRQVAHRRLKNVHGERKAVLEEGLGALSGIKAKIYADENASRRYIKVRPAQMHSRKKLKTN